MLIGATGLVGSHLLPRLEGRPLLSLARRATLPARPGWREKTGALEDWPALLEGEAVDVAVAAIGTTWAKVGNWEDFDRIDRHGVVEFARAARAAGARQLVVVSSAMARASSRSRYLQIKGQMEADVESLGYPRLDIVRPGLLKGARPRERRVKERLGIWLSPLTDRLVPRKLRSIPAETVAAAIAALAGTPGTGVHVRHNPEIRALAATAATAPAAATVTPGAGR
ncbi:NAD-dependent epimerase/dehydratase family protein [Sphingomicrobium astaxanthinifaciens]|uniref:NAD-dependent epimerase/dehydratase family protein n=1 Tax=Sphingomicrobium astaxanthinifaciens TaxID=1227949 RepID=UPI001FCAB7DF|nr:NAD-dependent epimerase/dehydratase family protein [Sphingomicrobium astaxanthinifaciens]MCJ7421648.1 NAD-dependent dehydratase [Sphingomicrobium astaxanthinifaciens]